MKGQHVKTLAAVAIPPPRKCGRPKFGEFRLQAMLPRYVCEELVRAELESGGEIYRTRVAANVLCEWAKQRQRQHLPAV